MGDFADKLRETMGKEKDEEPAAKTTPEAGTSDIGAVTTVDSVEQQAAQRRLARMSKYFTAPSGVLEGSSTGSTGVL